MALEQLNSTNIKTIIDNNSFTEDALYYGLIYAIISKNSWYENIQELAKTCKEKYGFEDITHVYMNWAWDCVKLLKEEYSFTSIHHFFDIIELHIKKQKEYEDFHSTDLYDVIKDIEEWEWE